MSFSCGLLCCSETWLPIQAPSVLPPPGEGGNDSEAEAPSALGGDGDGDDITTDVGGLGGRAEDGAMTAGARTMPGGQGPPALLALRESPSLTSCSTACMQPEEAL
jgi:hypothetical protein